MTMSLNSDDLPTGWLKDRLIVVETLWLIKSSIVAELIKLNFECRAWIRQILK